MARFESGQGYQPLFLIEGLLAKGRLSIVNILYDVGYTLGGGIALTYKSTRDALQLVNMRARDTGGLSCCQWQEWEDSNLRPPVLETGALPRLSYTPIHGDPVFLQDALY